MEEHERQQIIALVKREVVPAIGCTEPMAVARPAERQHPEERHGRGHSRHGHDRPAHRHRPGRAYRQVGVSTGSAEGLHAPSRGGRQGVHRREAHPHRPEGGD